jgi:hypothetical protein
MDERIRRLFAERAGDGEKAYQALLRLFELTEAPIDWAYDVWDALPEQLTDSQRWRTACSREPSRRAPTTSAAMASVLAITRPVSIVCPPLAPGAMDRE